MTDEVPHNHSKADSSKKKEEKSGTYLQTNMIVFVFVLMGSFSLLLVPEFTAKAGQWVLSFFK